MILDAQTLAILEWVAAGLGVINVALLIFRTVWNFPFGIASVAMYIFVFWEKLLYAEAALQVFFVLAQLWGWWLWVRVGSDDNRVPVRWLDWPSRAVWFAVTAAVSLNLGWVLHRFTNAAMPYADSAIAGASVAAQILLGLRRVENWIMWIAIDIAAMGLYINRGLYPTTGLYGCFLVLSLFGLKEWLEAARKQAKELAGT